MKTATSRRVCFLGCPLDRIGSGLLLDELLAAIRRGGRAKVIQFVNANKVAMVSRDPALGETLWRADYVLADGQPMLPMAAMLGMPVPERIDGVGLMMRLLAMADRERLSIYLLGARREVLEKCVARIREEYPHLVVAGFRDGYFKETDLGVIARDVNACSPDLLFLGMGSPLKERLADEWRDRFGARVIQGVGGSFDVLAGVVKRAPGWVQRWGLEWFYRVLQEPRRMFWRYAQTNARCLRVFVRALWRRWFSTWDPELDHVGSPQADGGPQQVVKGWKGRRGGRSALLHWWPPSH